MVNLQSKIDDVNGHSKNVLYGVKGWLAFFVFVSIFIYPLSTLGTMQLELVKLKQAYPEWYSSEEAVSWFFNIKILGAVDVICRVILGLHLKYRLTKASLNMAITYCFAYPFIFGLWGYMILVNSALFDNSYWSELFPEFLQSFLWGIYFIRSKRCKNTYKDE